MRILVLDNYDSFTYNLVHYLQKISGQAPDVFRNDEIGLEAVNAYDKILLSPGPGLPSEAGIMNDVIRSYSASKSILGICLGMQAIGEAYGGRLVNLEKVYHGVASTVTVIKKEGLFAGLPGTFRAGRYHSWVVEKSNLPAELEITATDAGGNIMALGHRSLDIQGVQFHPESILTEYGEQLLKNWLRA